MATRPVENVVFKVRRDLASEWVLKNPVLADGEQGLEKDTRRFKFGDGVSTWTELEYAVGVVPSDGSSDAAILTHIADETPHPVYDDGPSFLLLYENAKV